MFRDEVQDIEDRLHNCAQNARFTCINLCIKPKLLSSLNDTNTQQMELTRIPANA